MSSVVEQTRIRLPYGDGAIEFDVPYEVEVLLPNTQPPALPESDILLDALERPVAGPALRDVAKGKKSAIILISCRTRRTGSPIYVPQMLQILNESGIRDEDIIAYTATGTHANFRQEDAELLLGPEAARRIRFMGHDCDTPENLVELGTTSRGNKVRVGRTFLDSELKIGAGRVNYHYFAGFSAGRKSVLPGICAKDTILFNHAMAVCRDGDIRLNPECRNGNLDTNPIHLDMLEAAQMAPLDYTLCTVCNVDNQVTHAFGGDMIESHARAVEVVSQLDSPATSQPADIMFVSCGGAPSDINTIQAIKAVLNNYHAVRNGGAIICTAECPEGSPEWLLKACAIPTWDELKAAIAARQVRQAHNPLWIRTAREHAHVIMVTRLPDEDVRSLGFHKANTMTDALELAEKLAGKPRIAIAVPYGNVTYLKVGKDNSSSTP